MEAASTSGRRSDCDNVRTLSKVGVRVSGSSIADEDWRSVSVSSRLTSDAFEGRREGNCLGTALEAGGGIEILARTAFASLVSSDARPFLLTAAADAVPVPASRCGVLVRAFSALTVRESSI